MEKENLGSRVRAIVLGTILAALWGLPLTVFYRGVSRSDGFPPWHDYLAPWIGLIVGLYGLMLVAGGLRGRAGTEDERTGSTILLAMGIFHLHNIPFRWPPSWWFLPWVVLPLAVGLGWKVWLGRASRRTA